MATTPDGPDPVYCPAGCDRPFKQADYDNRAWAHVVKVHVPYTHPEYQNLPEYDE